MCFIINKYYVRFSYEWDYQRQAQAASRFEVHEEICTGKTKKKAAAKSKAKEMKPEDHDPLCKHYKEKEEMRRKEDYCLNLYFKKVSREIN